MRSVLVIAALLAATAPAAGKLKEKECEVCIKVLERITKDVDTTKAAKVEAALRDYCKETKIDKEGRFCYYIGASETSATGMVKQITDPLKRHLPVEKVCERLKKKDSQICELVYDVPIDLKTLNFKKARVKVLKKILNDQFNDPCKGCIEKDDYVRRIRELSKEEL
eukprot:m.110795 g.110795  ORF g.110795 m.110795 type:complete len:167 (+) comp10730_c1_seq1:1838-2338(+)